MYEWKSKHNAAFENDSLNECTIQCLDAKFRTEDESLTNDDRGWPEIAMDNEVLQAIVEKNPDNTARDYVQKLGASPITIARHLKCIAKVKKKNG